MHRPVRRLVQLYVGLVLFGASMALMIRAGLGVNSWDVLHQGIASRADLRFGWVVIGVSAIVLLLWIPLHQRPGIGTVSNVVVVGLAVDATLAGLPSPTNLGVRAGALAIGILANGLATGLYVGANLGPGPRDGLMTGLGARGYSVRAARTGIELGVLAVGWSLGGSVGVGTVLFALSIGPLVHYLIPRLTVSSRPPEDPSSRPREESMDVSPTVRPGPVDLGCT